MAITVTIDDELFFELDGKEYVNEEAALAILLADDVLFCNAFDIVRDGKEMGHTTVLFVNCNDMFAWACADAESFANEDIGPLLKMHLADKKWGSSKWCMIHRNEQPQLPVAKDMKKDGAWGPEMEALQPNGFKCVPGCSIHDC